MNHFSHMDFLSEWTSFLTIATKQIRTGPLRNAETKQSRVNLILVNYHTTDYWPINIVKVHCKRINNLRRTGFRSTFFLTGMGTFRMFLFTTLASWSRSTSPSLWFMVLMTFFILWIAPNTSTNFATSCWKFCFSYIFRNLANAWLSWLWKCLHAIFTASISGLKFFFFFLFIFFFLVFWMVFRIFTSKNEILFWASNTTASLTTLISKMRSSLISWDNTNTSFLIFVSVSMFTFFATIFVSDGALTFLFHGLFRCDSISNINLILLNFFIFFSLFNTFVLPFLILRWTAAYNRSGRWRWWWISIIILLLYFLFVLIVIITYHRKISDSLISDIFKEWVIIIELLMLMLVVIVVITILVLIVEILRQTAHILLLLINNWFFLL